MSWLWLRVMEGNVQWDSVGECGKEAVSYNSGDVGRHSDGVIMVCGGGAIICYAKENV